MPFFRKLRKGKGTEAPANVSAALALSKPIFPDGIKQLYPPSGTAMADAEVDICFVHGLTGDREKTWTADGQSAPWPQTLLPSVFPKARILTFGYDAYVVQVGVASANGLDNHAKNLLNDLVGDRQDCHAKSRPLIFVAHSLGGIVCKQAISFSRSSKFEHLQDIYNSVIGIAFMGTPHRGSSLASWASIPIAALGVVKSANKNLTDVLRIDNPLLKRTYDEFIDALAESQKRGKDIQIVCFYEELPIFKNLKVVPEHSAAMDGVIAMSIHANHNDMVRFLSKDGSDFGRLRRELARWIDDIRPPNLAKTDNVEMDDPVKDPRDTGCIQALRLTDPDDDRTRIEKKNGTFFEDIHEWVFSNDCYKQWKDGNLQSRLLWIRGDPGKGKTMILCSIIRNLKASETPLSYFFCQATNEQLNHGTAVLRGLIYNFIKKQPALVAHVRKKYDFTGKSLFEGENAWEALSKIFTDMIDDKRLAEAVILIDGLDECTVGRSQLLDLIVQPSHVRWLVSSRNWPDIEADLRGAGQKAELRLELNPDAIARAVDAYISLKVNQLAVKKGLEHETKNAVEQHLATNADGTFLWVALVCHALESAQRRNVRKELTSFPRGLLALYGRMMQTIQDADNADECRGILAVASTVYRPITLAELQVLCPSLSGLNTADLVEVIQYCGSFLTLRDDSLYFVHLSAKDYLVGEAQLQIFPHGLCSQHHVIASRSLAALSNVLRRDMYGLRNPGYAIEMVKPPVDDPLVPVTYSCRFWVNHLADAEPSQRSVSLQDGEEVHRFLLGMFLYWLEALSLLQSIWTGVVSVRKLHAMMNGKKQDLTSFAYDAQRFISAWAHVIAMAPLQTYASALLFSPTNSKVRKQFAEEYPDWVFTKHKAHAEWDACVQTLEGHSEGVYTVEFSPDGLKLASVSHTAKVWDVSSGQCTHTLADGRIFLTVTFSPDGQKLLSCSGDMTVQIWDPTGQLLQTLGTVTFPIITVALSRDGLKLASLSLGRTAIEIWDATSGQHMHTLEGHTMSVASVVFSPDGEKLASGSEDWKVKIWDSDGQSVQTLIGHGGPISSVAFAPGGRKLASGSYDGAVKVWDVLSGQCMCTLEGFDGPVTSVAFSLDGQKLASGSDNGTIRVWDLSARRGQTRQQASDEAECTHVLKDPNRVAVVSVAFSPDGRKLASGSISSTIKIWDLDGQPGWILPDHEYPISAVVLSREGQYLASRSENRGLFHTCMKILNTATGNLVQMIDDYYGIQRSLIFLPGEKFLAANLERGDAKSWNVETGTLARVSRSWDALLLGSQANEQCKEPAHRCLGLNDGYDWITAHGKQLLWLPPEYRPEDLPERFASQGRVVGIGTEGGRVFLFHFAPKFGIC